MIVKLNLDCDIDTVKGRVPTHAEIENFVRERFNGLLQDQEVSLGQESSFYIKMMPKYKEVTPLGEDAEHLNTFKCSCGKEIQTWNINGKVVSKEITA